jgi:thiamine pyrophosphate-dependent acetolactate synthase large subunit-like protein
MERIDVIRRIAGYVTAEDLVTTSIGATWDDWWNYKPANNTFFTGILGSVTTTALGMAVALPHRRILALESDGSVLMNTGAMCTLGNERPPNMTVVVMDNGIYENIGGPPTHTSRNTDLAKMADGAGCLNASSAQTLEKFEARFRQAWEGDQMAYIVAKIEPFKKYPWKWEDRKPTDGIEDKYNFLRYVEKLEDVVIHPGAAHN